MDFVRKTRAVLPIAIDIAIPVEAAAETGLLKSFDEDLEIVGAERLLLTPDCGFATFADNPLASADIATAKLKTLAAAAAHLRQRN